MARKYTIFQNIDRAFSGDWNADASSPHINSYDMSTADKSILYRTTNKDDYESKKLELQQNAYLKDRWVKANVDLSVSAYSGLNNVKLMYRDADLMDAFPEIGAALDIVTEESTITSDKGMIVNVYSKSDRIKSILEDLFVNRLNIQVTAPMVVRAMCKYGNQFMLLDIDNKLGVKGWKQLPVFNVERIENGIVNPYGAITTQYNNTNNIDTSTKFIWVNENNSQVPFRNWQIAHFRLLTNSLYLPYGCLVGDTRIETEYGYKEIKDIKVGDKVWTFNVDTQKRELSTVTMWMNKGEKDTIKIFTNHNYIEGTPDHKVLVYEDKKLTYKEIKDISIGDLLVVRNGVKKAKEAIKIDKTSIKYLKKRGNNWFDNSINLFPEYMTEDLAEFFGFMIGDGSITYGRIVNLAGGIQDILNDRYQSIAEKYSGYKGKRKYRKNGTLQSITFYSKFLGYMLENLGYICGFDKKRIPSWVFESPIEIKKAFIKGLINADGYIFEDKRKKNANLRFDIELENEELIKDLKILCQSLGYKTNQIFKRKRQGHFSKTIGEYITFNGYSFELSFYETQNTQEKCNDVEKRLEDGFKLEKVKKIEASKKQTTYDITVDSKNSNFFANGIVTHNCSYLNGARRHWKMLSLMEDLMLIYRLERSIERRVYKIYVGAIDDADVQAYVENIANNFKRTPIIDPMTGQLDLRKNILPVHKDTPIPLLDGRTITIENLAKEFEIGKENYVYSIQDKTHKIVPGKVVWCGKNYTAEKLYKITLDDDSYMILAGEHEIIMRDGTKKRADEVSIGESVMPLYRKVEPYYKDNKASYEKVYNPNSGKYEFTHRLVGFELKHNIDENVIHHSDFNRYNNSPSNLKWMKASKPLVDDRIIENGFSDFKECYAPIKKNHKIANIEIVVGDDVYCMTVVGLNGEEDRHNFALTTWKSDGSLNDSGCFVSNCADQDIFIPVRDQNAPTPIDTLSAAQNLTAMDDIKFVQNKVCTALRIPKTFLNFEEAQGNGNNLALEDIRFTRTVNRIQQAFLMELTKVASIHLYLLGFTDDLTNFNLTMNNPSTQAEQLEIDNLQKKITAARDAISDPGNGIPIMSQTRALKEIMKWSEKDIKDNLEEIRLEKGIAAELEKTSQIIKRTGLFDTVDRMYGEPGAEYQDDVQQQGDQMGGGGLGGGGGAPMGGGDFGSGLDDLGAPDSDENGDIAGAEGSEPTADMESGADTGGGDETGGNPMESRRGRKPILAETKRRVYKKLIKESEEKADKLFSQYLKRLDEANEKKKQETSIEKADIYDKSLMINEEFNKMLNGLNKKLNEDNEKADD